MNTLEDTRPKQNFIFLILTMVLILLIDIAWVYTLGYSLGQGSPGVWDSGNYSTFSFLLTSLSFYILPVLGIIGLIISIYSLRRKKSYLLAIILLVVSSTITPGIVSWSPTLKITHRIAGMYNSEWNNPTKTVKYQIEQVKKYNNIKEEIFRAHYTYYQNAFLIPQKISKYQYYETVFETENGLLITPTGVSFLSGGMNPEREEFRAKQDIIMKDINEAILEIKLPSYEIFKENYNLDISKIIQSSSINLEQYKDPRNEVWNQPTIDLNINISIPAQSIIIPVHMYYQDRAIHEELRCTIPSCL